MFIFVSQAMFHFTVGEFHFHGPYFLISASVLFFLPAKKTHLMHSVWCTARFNEVKVQTLLMKDKLTSGVLHWFCFDTPLIFPFMTRKSDTWVFEYPGLLAWFSGIVCVFLKFKLNQSKGRFHTKYIRTNNTRS